MPNTVLSGEACVSELVPLLQSMREQDLFKLFIHFGFTPSLV